MTITLERPDARVARTDSHPDLPLPGPRGVRRATSPFGTPARATSEEPLPPGVRLVRKRAAAPTSTLGRKLTMLAPVALLAGVSAGAVTLTPHVQSLVDGVRDQFGGSASAATAHAMSEHGAHAAPKHRAVKSATPDAARLPQHQQEAKHRAATPDPAATTHTGPHTTASAATPTGSHVASTSGSHRASSATDRTNSTSTANATGGKHKATSTPPPADTPPPSDPGTPSSDPAPGTPDPVGGLLSTVGSVVGGVVGSIGG